MARKAAAEKIPLPSGGSEKKKKGKKPGSYKRQLPPKSSRTQAGIVYVGHLPHGFYELQLLHYFKQFGHVYGVLVPRARKTGRPKGYGFVGFAEPAVAKVAAETMDNYLMFEKLLQCKLIGPNSKTRIQPKALLAPHKLPTIPEGPPLNLHAHAANRPKNAHSVYRIQKRLLLQLADSNRKVADAGIHYQFPIPSLDEIRASHGGNATADPSQYSLVIDSDDDEISFKAPPKSVQKSKATATKTPISSPLGLPPKKTKKTKKGKKKTK